MLLNQLKIFKHLYAKGIAIEFIAVIPSPIADKIIPTFEKVFFSFFTLEIPRHNPTIDTG